MADNNLIPCPVPRRAFLHPSVNPPHGGRQIFSQTKDSYLQINMDNQLVVHSVMYYGSKAPPAYKLSALIGLASTFLNPVRKGGCSAALRLL